MDTDRPTGPDGTCAHRWSQTLPQIEGKGLVSVMTCVRLGELALGDQSHVLRHVLPGRAGVGASGVDQLLAAPAVHFLSTM